MVVENFAPGVMDRLGIGEPVLRALNPSLIYASGSGYGTSGRYRDQPAMDLSMQAMSGVMATTGMPQGPPVKAGPAICDFLAGVYLYGAIVTALYRRQVTGEGSRVEVAMLDSIYPTLASNVGMHPWGTPGPSRTGNRHGGMSIAPYNVYPASDGHIAILAINDRHWRGVVSVLGLEEMLDDPRFATKASRVHHIDEVDRRVAEGTVRLPKAVLFERLGAVHVPCAPVRELQEVIDDPHLHETGMLRWIEHPEFGRVLVHDSPIVFGDRPRGDITPSPALGGDRGTYWVECWGWTRPGSTRSGVRVRFRAVTRAEAGKRGDDADGEDRHRTDRGGPARMTRFIDESSGAGRRGLARHASVDGVPPAQSVPEGPEWVCSRSLRLLSRSNIPNSIGYTAPCRSSRATRPAGWVVMPAGASEELER